jgi:hypothetical protein
MDFFFPTADGKGSEPAEEAEAHWQACRKGAESDVGRDALARRVHQLDYVHNGRTHNATVGQPDPYEGQTIMAIIAFPGLYSIRCLVRGFLKIGDPILVGEHDVLSVEDFDDTP